MNLLKEDLLELICRERLTDRELIEGLKKILDPIIDQIADKADLRALIASSSGKRAVLQHCTVVEFIDYRLEDLRDWLINSNAGKMRTQRACEQCQKSPTSDNCAKCDAAILQRATAAVNKVL